MHELSNDFNILSCEQIRSSQPGIPPTSFSSVFSTSGSNLNAGTANTSGSLGGGAIPQTLDQLLERQWEQGSQFLMEQAQHFDSECTARKNMLTVAFGEGRNLPYFLLKKSCMPILFLVY